MRKVLVVVASRHGATRGIGERIGETLRADGLEALVVSPADRVDVDNADAYVVGSGVYMFRWLKDATTFVERNLLTLSTRPVWLFSSGPLPGSAAPNHEDPLAGAFGPAGGPGSAGRKAIERLAAVIRPRGHRVFLGAYDPNASPRTIAERVIRILPASKGILPKGDFREWDVIEAWAHEIASALQAPVAAVI